MRGQTCRATLRCCNNTLGPDGAIAVTDISQVHKTVRTKFQYLAQQNLTHMFRHLLSPSCQIAETRDEGHRIGIRPKAAQQQGTRPGHRQPRNSDGGFGLRSIQAHLPSIDWDVRIPTCKLYADLVGLFRCHPGHNPSGAV